MAIELTKRLKAGQKDIPTRFRSKAQEDQVAKATGGQRQPNSGATPWAPGDVVSGRVLIECKTKMSASESITLHKNWIEKNKQEAVFRGLPYSVLAINFGPDQENYYIIDESTFIDFIDYLNSRDKDY